MSRLGRSQPVQPAAWHGFVDPGPGPVGTVPPRVVVVPHDPRPRQFYVPALVPISIHGPDSVTTATVPSPIVIDRVDQRVRFQPLAPIALSAALASVTAAPPVVRPSGPFVVPLDERRRFLAALAPTVTHGPSASTYTDTVTGTITLTGSATESETHSSSPVGAITLSGSVTESQTHSSSPSGTITLSGSVTQSASHSSTPSGTVTLSGTQTQSQTHSATVTGTITFGGTVNENFQPPAGPPGGNYRSQADEVRLLLMF